MIRGQKMPAEPKRPGLTIPIMVKLHNRFDIEVVDARTGEVKQRAYAENIILDAYWTKLFAPAVANSHIHVGTGTGTLAASRTSLFTFLTGKVSSLVAFAQNESEGWVSAKRSAQWSELENQNTAWTEVGIAYGTTNTNLTTHALIKDLNGNPVTINKGTTDIITVYATIYAYYPVSGFYSGKLQVPKVKVAYTDNRPPSLLLWMLGNHTPSLTGFPLKEYYVSGGDMIVKDLAYTPLTSIGTATRSGNAATKKLTVVCPRIAAASANFTTGIKGIAFVYSTTYPVDLFVQLPGSFYPYSAIVAESIGTGDGSNLDFATDFPFVSNDSSFVLKKNGATVDAGDYSVDYGIPNQNVLDFYFNILDQGWHRVNPGMKISPSNGGFHSSPAIDYCIFENPFYATYGINSFTIQGAQVYVSDSQSGPWTSLGSKVSSGGTQTFTVAAGNQNKRYWKIESYTGDQTDTIMQAYDFKCTALASKKNIHFGTGKAPALGDTVTADYHTDVIAKDSNHVFDLTVELTLQEKTS